MPEKKIPLLTLLLLSFVIQLSADVKLPNVFKSDMVVQRETQAPFWGWADAGETVKVQASWGKEAEAVANEEGKWSLKLDTPEAGGPYTVTIQGKNTIELKNVLSGEVWFCSGQSNMQMYVKEAQDKDAEISRAKFPLIRVFDVERLPSHQPSDAAKGEWKVCSPETVHNFSAAAYFFGRRLHKELNVPIGLITSSWGGTAVEPWTPRDVQNEDPEIIETMKRLDELSEKFDRAKAQKKYEEKMIVWEKEFAEFKANGSRGHWPRKPAPPRSLKEKSGYPGNLYNGMVHPVIPFAIRGVIWYQGESNSKRPHSYETRLKRLITGWREKWGQGDFPFYFVQLPDFRTRWSRAIGFDSWPVIRQAFLNTSKTVPNTGMAIGLGLGHPKQIHPRNKQGIGNRLALVALRKTYNKTDHAWTGPYYTDCEFENGKAIVTFENGNSPLAVKGDGKLFGFTLADKSGKFVRADAVIKGENTVIVSSPDISEPNAVLYAWANNPAGSNLTNKAGLPASPFLHGDMPEEVEEDLFAEMLPEEAGKYELLYSFNPVNPRLTHRMTKMEYIIDNHKTLKGPFKKVAYFLALKDVNEKVKYAFVSMDPFSQESAELGVPVHSVGKIFQQDVSGIMVKSNLPTIKTGSFDQGFNIEFWACGYGRKNTGGVAGADPAVWDFGDEPFKDKSPGYGSMQIHNYMAKQSVICFNKFSAGNSCDVGIGNSTGEGAKDWTLSGSAENYIGGEFKVLILK